MRTVDLIQRKRGGEELSPEEIEFLINGYTNGDIPDYQMSAFLMAVYFSGMTDREVSRLTECMLHSGDTVDLSGIPGVKVDKHSTGGVVDKTSFIVAPLAAAAGVVVPMMSGRALGHTGGTLDKLESIPGFRTDLTAEEFEKQLAELGLQSSCLTSRGRVLARSPDFLPRREGRQQRAWWGRHSCLPQVPQFSRQTGMSAPLW